MSQLVSTEVKIGDKDIRQFSTFGLSQPMAAHHSFWLVCSSQTIDQSGPSLHASKELIGAGISVSIKPVNGEDPLQFAGVVTQVEACHHSGHTGEIIISGFSPTILLDNGPHCKSWEKQTAGKISKDVLQGFAGNLLASTVNPRNGEPLLYTVQYKETAWEFLKRLSAEQGEWLFYSGKNLLMGQPNGGKARLVYGNNLSYFNLSLQVASLNCKLLAHDYINHEVYSSTPVNTAGNAGLNELGKFALQKSEAFYKAQPKQLYNHFLDNKEQLDKHINMRAAVQGTGMVRFQGSSGHTGVQLGGSVSVTGNNVLSQKEESYGEYTIVSVNHSCDGQGNYTNEFTAIPQTAKVPPPAYFRQPSCEIQSALVTDNYDELGLGRVRVKFHWMNGIEKTPWIRIAGQHGGGDKGMFFIPEIGEEVMVGFEGDDATRPFILGTVYHGKAKTTFSNNGNDVKVIQTRSGNKVVMNDKEGSMHLCDANGNNMLMDGKGNISITSGERIVLTCGSSKMEMKKDGTITVDGKIITTSASDKATMVSGGASFVADGKSNEADMAASTANVQGKATVTVNAGTKATVSAGVKVDVKGAIIALN